MQLDTAIDTALKPISDALSGFIFYPVPLAEGATLPFIVGWFVFISLFATVAFRFVNLRWFAHGWQLAFHPKHQKSGADGDIGNFQALSAALAGTIGLGNIAGVAVAVSVGGPGATIWMIIMGFLGMSTKFMEATLGVRYRQRQPDGSFGGGPAFYIRHGLAELGLKKLGVVLAAIFAVCTIFATLGGGNMFQANQTFAQLVIATGGESSWWVGKGWLFGLGMAVLVGIVIIGGITRIANVSTKLVPAMAGIYILACLVVLAFHIPNIPGALAQIWHSAFSLEAGLGGLLGAIIQGVRRAAFSNEAGTGSCAIIHGVAKSDYPAQQGMVAMHGAFLDTVVVCTLTALVIMVSGVYVPGNQMEGVALTSRAFSTVMPWFPWVLTLVVFLFAYSTQLTWGYYGVISLTYLFGQKRGLILGYQLFFCACTVLGAAAELTTIIDLSDSMFFMMALPNVVALVLLRGKVAEELRRYVASLSAKSAPA